MRFIETAKLSGLDQNGQCWFQCGPRSLRCQQHFLFIYTGPECLFMSFSCIILFGPHQIHVRNKSTSYRHPCFLDGDTGNVTKEGSPELNLVPGTWALGPSTSWKTMFLPVWLAAPWFSSQLGHRAYTLEPHSSPASYLKEGLNVRHVFAHYPCLGFVLLLTWAAKAVILHYDPADVSLVQNHTVLDTSVRYTGEYGTSLILNNLAPTCGHRETLRKKRIYAFSDVIKISIDQ